MRDFITGGATLVGDVITDLACVGLIFDGESSGFELGDFLNFCEDFRGGGLGGNGERRFFFFFSFALAIYARGFYPATYTGHRG